MVSTRGVKLKFFEGERVLCYEPDPTKAKVLYDSKVLDVVVNKDQRGRKSVEYLIHFQGWNSSWDRCVGEEFVLKDTAENRQLQKDLADKAQLQFGTYLYRRERKKRGRKTSEPVAHSSEDGSSGSPARMDTDDGRGPTSSSEEDSSGDEDSVVIELPQDLKQILEQDYFMINTKNKLLKLPAEPNVISILEMYWQHYVTNKLYGMNDKPNTRNRQPANQQKNKPDDLQKNINICKEVLDGIRIYFDFTLNSLLLYKREHGQIETQQAVLSSQNQQIKTEPQFKIKLEDREYAHLPNVDTDEDEVSVEPDGNCTNQRYATRRRGLRSDCSVDSNGVSHAEGNNIVKSSSSVSSTNNAEANTPTIATPAPPMVKALSWKLLPDYVYLQKPPTPSLVYGATHLLRLFVKLPELLSASSMSDEKLKVLLKHLEFFIEFLNEHKEWYSEKNYVD